MKNLQLWHNMSIRKGPVQYKIMQFSIHIFCNYMININILHYKQLMHEYSYKYDTRRKLINYHLF